MPFQSPRGTRDILPDKQPLWRFVTETAHRTAEQMGFQPISTPAYEELALFQRSIGEGTDVIDKELFLVRGKESSEEAYALRPEGTAGIVRAFIEHGMHTWPQPVKLYSLVNVFRYDRPQKGRYREHVQFDLEYFGDKGPFADAWVIYLTWQFLSALGLGGLQLRLNSLGTAPERERYIADLTAHFRARSDELSEDSRRRLDINPLRLLDSKDQGDQRVREDAPRLAAYFDEESLAHFEAVQGYLRDWDIPFQIDPFLVRGLDYYSHTTFEWYTEASSGRQSALGGGGRYDGLLIQLGGPDAGGVGAGLGLDRIVEEMEAQGIAAPSTSAPVYLAAADDQGRQKLRQLLPSILGNGQPVTLDLSKTSMGSQFKAADRLGASHVLIWGSSEADGNFVTAKRLSDGHQEQVPDDQLASFLSALP